MRRAEGPIPDDPSQEPISPAIGCRIARLSGEAVQVGSAASRALTFRRKGRSAMLILLIILLLVLGGGGGYYGHSRWGYGGGAGIGLGTILLILLVVFMFGGIHF
jgi:hypothetical protein